MKPFVILETGSRYWPSALTVADALNGVCARVATGRRVVVRHGDCPDGADRFTRLWADSFYGSLITHDPWPAEWGTFGAKAGPIRNSAMVQAGANVCVAFFGPCMSQKCPQKTAHWSHGTTDCARKARAAGIGVHPVFWTPDHFPDIPPPDFL